MEKQLLCTFTTKHYVISTLRAILETYVILYNKIFIYENNDDRQQYLCTYNISGLVRPHCYLPSTISIHRRKEWNCIYSINALNELIKELNNGILDIRYPIEWSNYQDTAFVISDGNLKKVKIRFKEIFYIKNNAENFDQN